MEQEQFQAWVMTPYLKNGAWCCGNRFPVGPARATKGEAEQDLVMWLEGHQEAISAVNRTVENSCCYGDDLRVKWEVFQVWPVRNTFGQCPYVGTCVCESL